MPASRPVQLPANPCLSFGRPEHLVFLMSSGRLWELCTQLVGVCKTHAPPPLRLGMTERARGELQSKPRCHCPSRCCVR
jgi:hypothetical protein